MIDYDDLYYIIYPDFSYEGNLIHPTSGTAKRKYEFVEVPDGSAPLAFEIDSENFTFNNDYHVYFDSPSLVISKLLYDEMKDCVYGGKFHPSTIISSNGKIRDFYWALNTYEPLDCWDRDKSIHDGEVSVGGLVAHASVEKYVLRKDILENIPEDNRLVFKMGNTDTELVFVHQKIVDLFNNKNVEGVKFFKVSEYNFGDEF